MSKTATFVRKLDHGTGEMRLYKLDPPMEDEYVDGPIEHVVVSATIAMFTGAETYIFPADAEGEITDWGELDGSYRGGLDHEAALSGAGYEVVS